MSDTDLREVVASLIADAVSTHVMGGWGGSRDIYGDAAWAEWTRLADKIINAVREAERPPWSLIIEPWRTEPTAENEETR